MSNELIVQKPSAGAEAFAVLLAVNMFVIAGIAKERMLELLTPNTLCGVYQLMENPNV